MTTPKAGEVKRGISVIWENLQCPVCLDLMSTPVSTRCDHQFCKFCIMKLLDKSKKKEASCPVCKTKVTKRSLQESPGFQRLVEGLQNLIQSYEFDTCTNYFTGMPQKTPEDSVDQQFPGEVPSPEDDGLEKAQTPSSAAAKDAFARLMSLEDSCTANPLQDCSDSGLGGLPQVPEKEQSELEDFLSGREDRTSSSSVDPNGGPNDGTSTSMKRSGLRSQSSVGLESDRIVDKRQKKSVEKVSEWLLKISSSSRTQTKHNSTVLSTSDSDCEKDSDCSYAPTEVIVNGNDKKTARPSREPLVQGLEKQVFGAVYKRQNKLAKTRVSRVSSTEREIMTAPCPLNVAAEDTVRRYMSKKTPSGKLTPADFIKKSCSDDKGENVDEQGEVEEPTESAVHNTDKKKKQEKVAESNRNASLKCPDEKEKLMERSKDEECIGTIGTTENSPEFDVPVNRPERRSKVKMKDAWRDSDLKLKENKSANKKGQKQRFSRNSCESAKDNELYESKNAKHTKALALVRAGNETLDFVQKLTSKPELTEAEVTIESYPSSAEPRSPDSRKIRRSLRLQAFTAEVQVTRERRRALPKPADQPASEPSCSSNPPEVNYPITSVDSTKANEGKAIPVGCLSRTADERPVKINGCVYNSRFEITEVQPREGAAPLTSVTGEVEPQVSIVPDTMDSDGQNPPGSATVVKSPGPVAAGLPYSFSPEEHQEPPSAAASAPVVVRAVTAAAITPAGETIEEQGDTNDSELDTEQLLKTFKATKRKSFCLGSPKASYSKGEEGTLGKTVEDSELFQEPIPDTVCRSSGHNSGPASISHSDLFLPSNKGELSPSEKSSSPGNAGVASVTRHQATTSALASGSEEHVLLKNSEVCMSPALTPNKVAKPSQESRCPVNCEMVYSFQLFSASVAEDVCTGKSTREDRSPTSGTCLTRTPHMSQESQMDNLQCKSYLDSNKTSDMPNSGVQSNPWESSVTPDGLVPVVAEHLVHKVIESAAPCSSEKKDVDALSPPLVRRKRKAQQLNSSDSELSAEDDDLPSLAQIFRSHQEPLPSTKRPQQKSDLSNQDGDQLIEHNPNAGLDHVGHLACPLSEAEPEDLVCHVSPPHEQETPENVVTMLLSAGQDGSILHRSCRDEAATSSQGSVDLFGTPDESEAVDCRFGNAGHSMDSSQYSSEIINTQQREEMQQDLCRLKRMMALVSEALHQKESDSRAKPSDASDQSSGADLSKATAHGTGTQPDRLSGPAPGPACLPRGPETPHVPQIWSPLSRAQVNTERRSSQKPGSSPRLMRRSGVELEVKVHGSVSEGAPAVLEEGQEDLGVCEGVNQPGVRRSDSSTAAHRMEVVASGLTAAELSMVKKFVRKRDASLSRRLTPNTTHIIIKTDEHMVCERTLKYFQGIAGRKWVVSFLWIFESFKQCKVLDEALFEVRGDVVNGCEHNGPRKSRSTPDDNMTSALTGSGVRAMADLHSNLSWQLMTCRDWGNYLQLDKLLMKACEICFQGSFTDMTTDQMEAMVRMCGGAVVRDPLLFTKQEKCQLVVVQPASDETQSYYRALQTKATVVTRSWLLDTIATYTLQNPEDYRP